MMYNYSEGTILGHYSVKCTRLEVGRPSATPSYIRTHALSEASRSKDSQALTLILIDVLRTLIHLVHNLFKKCFAVSPSTFTLELVVTCLDLSPVQGDAGGQTNPKLSLLPAPSYLPTSSLPTTNKQTRSKSIKTSLWRLQVPASTLW